MMSDKFYITYNISIDVIFQIPRNSTHKHNVLKIFFLEVFLNL